MHDATPELLQEASQGSQLAIDRLLEQNLPRLRAFIRLRCGPQLRAKESDTDIVQSVCRELLQDLSAFEYRGAASFRAWLFQAAMRKILDKNRYYQRHRRNVAREQSMAEQNLAACYMSMTSPSEGIMRRERVAQFERVFDQLPADYQEVITHSKIVRLSHAEIAEQMGRSEQAVRVLLHRALARLAVLLEGAEASEAD